MKSIPENQSAAVPDSQIPPDNAIGGIADTVELVLGELTNAGHVQPGQIVVIGTSTSEVLGKRIGTAGTEEVAREIYEGVRRVKERIGFQPAFQCCEHLNRALVVERELLDRYPLLEQVSVVPVRKAGGSMAAYAFRAMHDALVVESIRAHAGLDIGGTLIGMHLKAVAVPVRPSVKWIGQAFVQMAYTRPKLIGGARAVYERESAEAGPACN